MKISPEAGTVKNKKPRTVPLHEHLIKQGFVRFVKANGKDARRDLRPGTGDYGAHLW